VCIAWLCVLVLCCVHVEGRFCTRVVVSLLNAEVSSCSCVTRVFGWVVRSCETQPLFVSTYTVTWLYVCDCVRACYCCVFSFVCRTVSTASRTASDSCAIMEAAVLARSFGVNPKCLFDCGVVHYVR